MMDNKVSKEINKMVLVLFMTFSVDTINIDDVSYGNVKKIGIEKFGDEGLIKVVDYEKIIGEKWNGKTEKNCHHVQCIDIKSFEFWNGEVKYNNGDIKKIPTKDGILKDMSMRYCYIDERLTELDVISQVLEY